MSNKASPISWSCRVLARLLDYPGDALFPALPELLQALREEAALSSARLAELEGLVLRLARGDRYALQAAYVDTFDRGRSTSLHLFEHVHGDSRERGPALVDLARTYEQGGLFFDGQLSHEGSDEQNATFTRELPDYLPVVLEFASTQAEATARAFLAEMTHILNAIHTALIQRDHNPYAAVLGAALELAGEIPQPVQIAVDEPLDEAWAEPAAFDGCSSRGQSRPGEVQPIHIVKRQSEAGQGVRP